MDIKLDTEKCIGCGTCESICPDIFAMGEDMKVHLKAGQVNEAIENKMVDESPCAIEAADSCAVEAIEVQE